jgi:hypothetical protein
MVPLLVGRQVIVLIVEHVRCARDDGERVAQFVSDHREELILGTSQFQSELFSAAPFHVLPDLSGEAAEQTDQGVFGIFDPIAVHAQRAQNVPRDAEWNTDGHTQADPGGGAAA